MSSHLNPSIYNFLLPKSLHCSEVQCSVVQWSEVQCSEVQCSTTQCSAMQCTQFSAVQCISQTKCGQVQWSFKVYNFSKYLSQPLPTLEFRVQAQPGFEFSAARIWVCCWTGLSFPVLLWLYCIFFLQQRPLILTAPAPANSKPGSSKVKPLQQLSQMLKGRYSENISLHWHTKVQCRHACHRYQYYSSREQVAIFLRTIHYFTLRFSILMYSICCAKCFRLYCTLEGLTLEFHFLNSAVFSGILLYKLQ